MRRAQDFLLRGAFAFSRVELDEAVSSEKLGYVLRVGG